MGVESNQADAATVAGLRERLAGTGRPLLLDGATGTELERAGLPTGLPLWSAHALLRAPDAVAAIHGAHLRAGAEIVTANTFRTQARTLIRAGLEVDSDRRLTGLAVDLARRAVREALEEDGRPRFVAGSLPPLEDCYSPDLVPSRAECDREHARQVELLVEAGVDLILVETMNSLREAESAIRAASGAGLPFVVSFVSWTSGRLLSGDELRGAAEYAAREGAAAVGVNCVPPSSLAASLAALSSTQLPLFVSPNLGEPDDATGFHRSESLGPDEFAATLDDWLARPSLRMVGGCCGTKPDHVAALARRISGTS